MIRVTQRYKNLTYRNRRMFKSEQYKLWGWRKPLLKKIIFCLKLKSASPWYGSGEWHQLEIGVYLFTQTGVGITGIPKLLYYYSFALLTGENIRPADLIFNPLAFPNNLILLFRGISEICSAFQYKHFLNDVEYQVFFIS